MGILAIIVVGLVAGLLARLVVPGRSGMGIPATVVLGIVGSFVGGFVGSLFTSHGSFGQLHSTGIVFSTLGAILVLLTMNAVTGKRVS